MRAASGSARSIGLCRLARGVKNFDDGDAQAGYIGQEAPGFDDMGLIVQAGAAGGPIEQLQQAGGGGHGRYHVPILMKNVQV